MRKFLYHMVNRASIWRRLRRKMNGGNQFKEWLPDITISREPGSGGRVIAEMVAKKLRFRLLDKEILAKLASKLGIPEYEFAKIDERPRNWLSDTLYSILNPNYVSDVKYIKHLKQLIVETAKKDSVVIVGRGANFVLPPERVLRVRITASWETRVRNTAKYEHKTRANAEEWVYKVEKKRDDFVRQYFEQDPDSVTNYDLTMNTDHLSLEAGRDMIVNAFFDKFPELLKKK
jgi:cytidylate kinase